MTVRLGFLVLGLLAWQPTAAAQQLQFELPGAEGMTRVAVGEAPLTAVCFLGTECPMARSYATKLNQLQQSYAADGLRLVGVFSNRQDSFEDLTAYCRDLSVQFPVGHDVGNVVADRFGATRTPEVFLLDAQLKLRYHGRIDDQYAPGVARNAATREDLRTAIDELLAGKPVSIRETPALGCIIGKVDRQAEAAVATAAGAVTYAEHIVDVLQRNCIECHRAGEIGPFAMDSYDEVVGWADTMLETIDNGRMPPWHADPQVGHFANQRLMSVEDRRLFREWVAGGAPAGDLDRLPPPLEFTEGWQLSRQPDLIVDMRDRPFVVPRDGVVEYQYFVADLNLVEDKWVSAAQVIPGSREVVHHAIVFIRPPDGSRFRGVGWLNAYVPGQRIRELPPGFARRIPAGSKLVFQMHYTPNGRERPDTTKVGLLFTDAAQVTHEVYTLAALDQEFEIPPRVSDHAVRVVVDRLPRSSELLAVTPHMHFRGSSFKLFAGEDGATPVLHVPNYDFNWQHTYELSEPLPLDEVGRLQFDVRFDNSQANPFNPNPDEWVTWGDQTWEEMAVAFFEVAEPLSREPGGTAGQSASGRVAKDASAEARAQAYVRKVLAELDRNGDGLIRRSETGIILRRWNFGNWDSNGDDVVTTEELWQVARSLVR